jgi:hypothetical protein
MAPSKLNLLEVDLEPFHKVLSDSPHTSPLPVYVHRDREKQQNKLDDPNPDVHRLRPISRQPPRDEQAEDETVENILAEVERNDRPSALSNQIPSDQ